MIDLKVVQTKLFAKVTNVSIMNQEAVNTLYMDTNDLYGEGVDNGWFRRRSPASAVGDFAPPAVLVIDGENFKRVTDVWVRRRSVSFEIITDNRIFAIIPHEFEDSEDGDGWLASTVFVLTDSRNFANTSLLTYGFGDHLKLVDGASKLCSQVVKLLMTTPGSDSFEKNTGGGLTKFPGAKVQSGTDLTVPVILAVTRVAEQIKASQRRGNLQPSEKLRGIQVLGINYDDSKLGALELTLKIDTFSSESVAVQVMTGAGKLLNDIVSGNLSVTDKVVGGILP